MRKLGYLARARYMKNRERVKKTLKVKHHWKTPDEGVIKINKNASFLYNKVRPQSIDSALCPKQTRNICDHWCGLIRGQSIWYENAASALIMEAREILDGIKFGRGEEL
jgi:hypothetical protein